MIELTSALTSEECLLRLQQASDPDDWDHPAPAGAPMLVSIRGGRFTVMNASDDLGWRTFRRHFYGEIADRPGGLVIRGRFRLHQAARLSLTLWFGSMAAIVALLLIANLAGAPALPAGMTGWSAIVIPALMLAVAAGLVRWSLNGARRGEAAVVRFLQHVLDAGASGGS